MNDSNLTPLAAPRRRRRWLVPTLLMLALFAALTLAALAWLADAAGSWAGPATHITIDGETLDIDGSSLFGHGLPVLAIVLGAAAALVALLCLLPLLLALLLGAVGLVVGVPVGIALLVLLTVLLVLGTVALSPLLLLAALLWWALRRRRRPARPALQ